MIDDAIEEIVNGNKHDERIDVLREEYLHGNASETLRQYGKYDAEQAFHIFINKVKPQRPAYRRWIGLGIAVAAVALALLVLVPLMREDDRMVESVTIAKVAEGTLVKGGVEHKTPIPQHSDKVPTLRLATGEVIELTGDRDVKLGDVAVSTHGSNISISSAKTYSHPLVLSIPRGRQFDLTLSDGTHVWLNSETTLTFPSQFNGERHVSVSGQAYFDVAHTGEPFSVECSRGTVKVMGTTFDVRDYKGETTQVTLVSGSVAYTTPSTSNILAPGEQINHETAGSTPTKNAVDTHQFTAWKDGLIYFYEQRLEDVMKEIERMYDVKVIFDDRYLCDRLFTGECSRYESVEEFLRLLSLTDEFSYNIEKNNNQKYITITIKQ